MPAAVLALFPFGDIKYPDHTLQPRARRITLLMIPSYSPPCGGGQGSRNWKMPVTFTVKGRENIAVQDYLVVSLFSPL